jgi:hypothetical protein
MPGMSLPAPADIAAALGAAYFGITEVVTGLDDRGLLLTSGCHGWTICDLLLHVTLDAQRALITLATPADGPPDVDFVTYWRGYSGAADPDAADHAQWVRRTSAAFVRPSEVVARWAVTAPAAARAAAAADPAGLVSTQGHVLTVPDFVATLVTEAVVHHFDVIAALPEADGPPPAAVSIALDTLAGLAAPATLPAGWDDRETLLKATGRQPLDAAESRTWAHAFPLLR